jgi:folate-dependent phosphoribosylglycinamide formyltransferase PurN
MKLAIFFSGGASTACAVQNAVAEGILTLDLVLAISSNPKASGIEKLKKLGIKVEIVNPKDFPNSELFGQALLELLRANKVDIIAQLGWLAKTPSNVINAYPSRIINQHPGPLDHSSHNDFGGTGMHGLRVHAARLHFAKNTGVHNAYTEASSHYVTKNYDEGKVVGRTRVEIPQELLRRDLSNPDSFRAAAEELQQLVLPYEHALQIEALSKLVTGEIKILDRAEPLVKDSELKQLETSKKIAVALYTGIKK